MLEFEERERIRDFFDVYDLVEELDISVEDILDRFEDRLEDNEEILRRIGSIT